MAVDEPEPTLAEVGEFGIIDRLVAGRVLPPSVTLGPGDDAAVVTAPDGRTVVCTDMLVQDRHFRLDWSTPFDVGRKAVAQNVADIEAMGARCTALVVGFGAPADTPAAQAVALADGMWHEAGLIGAAIVGGDMVAAGQWVISVAALGDLGGREPVRRSGARPGDVVAVAGHLGRSAAGYALLSAGIAAAGIAGGHDDLRRSHLVPEPPYGQGVAAACAGAHAMTDVSDGLLADLGHVSTASAVAIDLQRTALAQAAGELSAAAAAVGVDPLRWVVGGGEDHALVATFPGAVPPGWWPVGTVGSGEGVTVDGDAWAGHTGWQSF